MVKLSEGKLHICLIYQYSALDGIPIWVFSPALGSKILEVEQYNCKEYFDVKYNIALNIFKILDKCLSECKL